jgi:hypothetical protein
MDNSVVVQGRESGYFWGINLKTSVMKTNWKHFSAALLILAGTARAGAVTTDADRNPVEKDRTTTTTAVQARGEKVYVNLLNLDGSPVTVKVYDGQRRLLYIKRFEETPVVEKAFNFEEAYQGTYRVFVYDGEETYSASVEVAR